MTAALTRAAIIEECISRAEQAVRYALKHQQFDGDELAFRSGWEVAAAAIEAAIGPHVRRHMMAPTFDHQKPTTGETGNA